jgi:hypothetical protein
MREERFKKLFQCKQFADRMQAALVARGEAGFRIRLVPPPGAMAYSAKEGALGAKGLAHDAIQIGNTVFDNVRPEGMSLADFAEDMGFDVVKGNGGQITFTPF